MWLYDGFTTQTNIRSLTSKAENLFQGFKSCTLLLNFVFLIIVYNCEIRWYSRPVLTICCGSSNTEVSHRKAIIYFWAIMSIAANNHWKRFVYYSPIKSNIRKTSSFWEAITSALPLIAFMASTTNVCLVLTSLFILFNIGFVAKFRQKTI